MTGWISIKDRLPKCNIPVLAYCQDGQFVCQRVRNSKMDIYGYPFLWKVFLLRDYFFDIETFSHWQPLPEPPKGAQNE